MEAEAVLRTFPRSFRDPACGRGHTLMEMDDEAVKLRWDHRKESDGAKNCINKIVGYLGSRQESRYHHRGLLRSL